MSKKKITIRLTKEGKTIFKNELVNARLEASSEEFNRAKIFSAITGGYLLYDTKGKMNYVDDVPIDILGLTNYLLELTGDINNVVNIDDCKNSSTKLK